MRDGRGGRDAGRRLSCSTSSVSRFVGATKVTDSCRQTDTAVHPDLLTVPNVVLTPHIASATLKTRMAMAMLAADNLIAYLTEGRALTPLNPQVIRG